MNPNQVLELATDRRMFREVFDVQIVDDIYKSANYFVEVYDQFGRKTRTIFGNVFPKVGESFDTYSPAIIGNSLMQHMYDMCWVHRQHSMQCVAYPFAGLQIHNIERFLRGELPVISVANGVVVDGEKVMPVRLPVAAKHLLLGNELLELRNLFKDGYRPQKLAQFLVRWKSYISDLSDIPKNAEELGRVLEHLAALHDREFEYGPEGVGITYVIGKNVTVKYHKPKKSVLIEDATGEVFTFDLATQGPDIVSVVLEAITGAPHNGLMGIHDGVGYAAIEGLKERLMTCADDRLSSFVRSGTEFVVVRHDRPDHTGVLITALDHHNQGYLIFVINKGGATVRQELHSANRMDISNFYNVIAGFMEVGK